MLCLGIESTAHTFSVAIVRKDGGDDYHGWTFLSNIRKPYVTKKGGFVPAQVSDHHVAICGDAFHEALATAGVRMDDVDCIAFSQGPGIGSCLRIGIALARSLSLRYNKPLVAVNHCVAHLEIGRILSGYEDPVLLYASGANTQIIAFEQGRYRVFGETLDIGVGNFLDQVARSLGLGFPGGPQIEALATQGSYVPIPYTVKGMDVQFGGMVSHIKRAIAAGEKPENICYSMQETAFAMLTEVAERALSHTHKQALVLGGGVACNARLQAMCAQMAAERGAVCYVPPKEFLVDNAGMIAATGALLFLHGITTPILESGMLPQQRTDAITVTWR
jgi:glycoprotease/Kae1 family metallohydrolase